MALVQVVPSRRLGNWNRISGMNTAGLVGIGLTPADRTARIQRHPRLVTERACKLVEQRQKLLALARRKRGERAQLRPARRLRQALEHRSEEHTSELQSLRHLVCRLL